MVAIDEKVATNWMQGMHYWDRLIEGNRKHIRDHTWPTEAGGWV